MIKPARGLERYDVLPARVGGCRREVERVTVRSIGGRPVVEVLSRQLSTDYVRRDIEFYDPDALLRVESARVAPARSE